MVKKWPVMQETQVQSLGGEDPPKKETATVFLPGKSHGQRSLVVSSPWCAKSQAQLSD